MTQQETASDSLCALHERLVLDEHTAFTGDLICGVVPTIHGRSWLNDYHRYRQLWKQLEHSSTPPATILKLRFGFFADDELVQEPSGDSNTPS